MSSTVKIERLFNLERSFIDNLQVIFLQRRPKMILRLNIVLGQTDIAKGMPCIIIDSINVLKLFDFLTLSGPGGQYCHTDFWQALQKKLDKPVN